VNPSRTRPFPKQAEQLYGRDGNRRDGPSTRRKRERIGALVLHSVTLHFDHSAPLKWDNFFLLGQVLNTIAHYTRVLWSRRSVEKDKSSPKIKGERSQKGN
jgi:hypothetical protein